MAYYISTRDQTFISQLPESLKGAKQVYLVHYCLKTPDGTSKEEKLRVAEQLAMATNRDVVDRLKLQQIMEYTDDISKAKKFDLQSVSIGIEFIKRFQNPSVLELEIVSD